MMESSSPTYLSPRIEHTHPKCRYFLYARKSSEPNDRQVLSIDSQKRELLKIFGSLDIVEIIEEAKSAKAPGRPEFDRMMHRIEAGEARGIIAWHPDRLVRNSVDGGSIIYYLDQGKLVDLKFAQYRFENTPEGKLMLNMLFGQSKYQVDKLGTDVKRGMGEKVERGWYPSRAPMGYLNEYDSKAGFNVIIKDPKRYPLLKRMWDLMLTGVYSAPQILNIANEEMGFRTPQRKESGGGPLSYGGIYKLFSNPFYYGWFQYNGQLYHGKHEPMITEEEFWRVQKILGRKGRPRPKEKKHLFAYTGMIRCGECGCMVIAEEKWKRNKTNDGVHHYIYYRCQKRDRKKKCSQRCIRLEVLERQIEAFLASLSIPDDFLDWAIKYMRKLHANEATERRAVYGSLESAYRSVEYQIDSLLDVRLRLMISDEEFQTKRSNLIRQRERLKERLSDTANRGDRWFDLVERTLAFSRVLRERFETARASDKRLILETVASNLTLCDMKLHAEPFAPFSLLHSATSRSLWQRVVVDVRTFWLEHMDDVPGIANFLMNFDFAGLQREDNSNATSLQASNSA